MDVQLGIPALIECAGFDECLDLCCRLECGFLELNMNLPWCQLDAMAGEEMPRKAAARGKSLTIHMAEDLDVCHFNADVARVWRETMVQTVHFAVQNGIAVITMHMSKGIYFTLPDRKVYLYGQHRDHFLSGLARFRDDCARVAGNAALTIGVEHTDFDTPFLRDGVALLLESPVFGLTWDIGHAHSADYMDRSFHEEHMTQVKHMHLHDARGKSNHLPWGNGEVDLPAWLALAERQGCRVVVETKTVAALRQSLAWLKQSGIKGDTGRQA